MLVLLVTAVTGAWAQTETLLTTITATGKDSYSETTPGVVTVTHDCDRFSEDFGWIWKSSGSLTVKAKDGYTITKCVFSQPFDKTVTVSTAPFKVNFVYNDEYEQYICEGTNPDFGVMNGVLSIEVYGYASYSVTMPQDTPDAEKWTARAGTDGTYQQLPLEGVAANTAVSVKYSGTKMVKSVKARKKAVPVTTYTLLSAATTSDYGKVVCAAGHLHDAKTAVPAGCTAVGILGKVTATGHGLILALQDATSQEWGTINGWTSVTTYAGTTLKVLPDDAARGTNLTSYTALGETAVSNWAVAQKSDYEAIFQNLGSTINDNGYTYDDNVNAYITTGVGGTALSDEYWSATEYAGDGWGFGSEFWDLYGKTNGYSARPVLGFGGEATPAGPTASTLSAATAEDVGKVVCAAGHLHDAKTAVPAGCTAVGILGKVTATGHGLILALQNATAQNWNTINGWTSVTTYAGTTLKVLPDDAARGTNLTSYTALGETAVSNWAVAQKSDYEAIFENLGSTTGDSDGMTYDGNVNAYITTGVIGDAISGYYWSATESNSGSAWIFVSDCWGPGGKTESYTVRPVLGFGGEAVEPAAKTDLLSGVFSVSASKKVNFSKGNLRYASGAWSFFDNQYDYYDSYSADAWDKFGWSTSATTYGMNTSTSISAYSGDFVDWGAKMGTGWFTLSSDEWTYLFNTRTVNGGTGDGKSYTLGQSVNSKLGVVIYPDNYTGAVYSGRDWASFESAGCVFLPIAGLRNGSSLNYTNSSGYYWSATPNGTNYAYRLNLGSNSMAGASNSPRYYGCSVRLVREVATSDAAPAYDETKSINDGAVTVAAGEHWLITGTGEATTNIIIIENNATVTLSGVNITAWDRSITCEGNATIILADGTTNNLYPAQGEYGAAGIEMRGGSGTSLTIQGNTGVLNITSGSGPAIGAGYDYAGCAINIEGGIINATSTDGPGIGAGYETACGNITISGGTVAATGGNGCPGIGGASSANCGDITITSGVTSVTATKGSGAPYSIGASSSGSCGTVTIGGVVGAITESPFTYPAAGL